MKTLFKVLFGLAALLMAYLCVMSIYVPVSFTHKQEKREGLIQKRLKDIASYEQAYKAVHGKFANGDELINFLENGDLYYVVAEGDFTDEMREKGLTEQQAAAQGLIKRDTVRVRAKDSLLNSREDINSIKEILEVPGFSPNRIEIEEGHIQQVIGVDTINVSVFRAQVPMTVYLQGMDENIVKERITEAKSRNNGNGYPGLRIGSLEEFKLTGNWE